MWNKWNKPQYIQFKEVTMVMMLCSASYWWTIPIDLRPKVLDAREQVVIPICTFKRLETTPLWAISGEKGIAAEEVNTSNMIKYL